MIHLLTEHLGPSVEHPGHLVMRTACGKKAVVGLAVRIGQTLTTPDDKDRTCPGCAEALQVQRMRRIKREEQERAQELAQAEDPNWMTRSDPTMGELGSDDGLGDVTRDDPMGEP